MDLKLYQHFKGGLYIVISSHANDATNNATCEDRVVVYSCVFTGATYTREFSEFHENVELEGKRGPRFRAIADPADIMPEGGHP